MKKKRLWILPGALLLLSPVFLFLSFRFAVSNTQALQMIMVTELEGNYLAREIVQALKNLYNIQDPTGGLRISGQQL